MVLTLCGSLVGRLRYMLPLCFWPAGECYFQSNPLICPEELQRGGDVRREKSSGRSVMGVYSWVGAGNLNRQLHCSGQVPRGGADGLHVGKKLRELPGWEQVCCC